MGNDFSIYFNDALPRKTVYWKCTQVEGSTHIMQIQTNSGLHWYITGNAISFSLKPISDFTLLGELLELGKSIENLSQAETDYNDSIILSNNELVEKVSKFIERNGFPYLAEELTVMPSYESERLKQLSVQDFLTDGEAWQPTYGTPFWGIILAAKALYQIWSSCNRIQNLSDKDPSRESLINEMNLILSHAGWIVQKNGIDVIHIPQLAHLLRFSEAKGQYLDYYESDNLFCILFDQLYSFIADCDNGKYHRIKECPECNRKFIPNGKQMYCRDCKGIVATRKSTERSRRHRARKKLNYDDQMNEK